MRKNIFFEPKSFFFSSLSAKPDAGAQQRKKGDFFVFFVKKRVLTRICRKGGYFSDFGSISLLLGISKKFFEKIFRLPHFFDPCYGTCKQKPKKGVSAPEGARKVIEGKGVSIMKTKKQIMSAIAALTVVSALTGVTAFAANRAEANKAPADPPAITEEAAETDEASEDETTAPAEETTVAADETDAEATETTTTVTDTDDETTVVEDGETGSEELPPAPADAEAPEKPEKPADMREIIAMIQQVFDPETNDFKDDQARADWFAFCETRLGRELNRQDPPAPVAPEEHVAPEAPEAPAAPEAPEAPEAPAAPEEHVAPEAPEAPVPPVAPEAPEAPEAPAAPAEHVRPQPPVGGPAAHPHHELPTPDASEDAE